MRQSLILLSLLVGTQAWAGLDPDLFPVDDRMRVQVDFWKSVYTKINSRQGYMHDSKRLNVIYETVDISGMSRRARRRFVKRKRREIKGKILGIHRKKMENLTDAEEDLLELMGKPSLPELLGYARSIRFQQGMRDRYYEGLKRSFLYIDKIREIFVEMKLPIELSYLPHVESSFNYKAYSKVGAAGVWQFMRATARLYRLKINYLIDERRDPLKSARAAAKLLRDNHRKLKTWPLALTAYNHGPRSLERAVRSVGSWNMSDIVARYKGRRFGFASRNFYATYVAATEISMDPDDYFEDFVKPKPFVAEELALPKSLTVSQISQVTGVSKNVLREYNLALRPSAFRSRLYLPKNYKLKLPVGSDLEGIGAKLASAKFKVPKLEAGGTHIVSRGDSLYLIAKAYRVSVRDLIVLNGISNPSAIHPGMKVKIPGKGEKVVAKQIAKKPPATPKEEASPQPEEPPVVAAVTPKEKKPGLWSRFKSFFVSKPKAPEEQPTQAQAPAAKKKTPIHQALLNEISIENYDFEAKQVGNFFRVKVETEETLGHYADWALVPTSKIRRANGLRSNRIRLGQKIKIPGGEKKLMRFNLERLEYHEAIEEDFFGSYRMSGTEEVVIRSGDTVEDLTRDREIPLWLFKRFNPDLRLMAGQKVRIPVVEPIKEEEAPVDRGGSS